MKKRANSRAPVGQPVAPGDDRQRALAAALSAAAAALAAAAQALGPGSDAVCTIPSHTPAAPAAPAPPRLLLALAVTEAITEFLVAKARAGRSPRYLRQLRVSLSSFASGRGQVPIASITLSEVEAWLNRRDWSPRTRAGYLADLRTLWSWCHRRGLVPDLAPVTLERETLPPGAPPGIHTPAQVASILKFSRRNPDVLRHLAVRYFAGVRTSEAHRMREENILADRGVIEVPAAKSKTRRRRLVTIQPALAAWLAVGGRLRAIDPDTVRAVIRASGVPWPKNVARHSFVSYHLAQFGNAARTALEAGHTESVLFAHYRELVGPADAAAFGGLRPD
jgi:integrase